MTLNFRNLTLAAAVIAATAGTASAQTLLFDDLSNYQNGVTNATGTSTGSTPNTFMGDGYTLLAGASSISGFDVAPVNLSGTTYTGIQGTIYVWGAVNTGAVTAAAPAFSNLLSTTTFTSAGTYNSGFVYYFQTGSPGTTPGITLNTPISLTSNTVGITISYAGTTDGVTYTTANSLTSLITTGTPPTVGSEVFNGYYRNANSETNGNFTSTLRTLSLTNQSLGLRVFGKVTSAAAPEPSAALLALPGAMLMVGGIVRRRRARA